MRKGCDYLQDPDYCTDKSAKLFQTITGLHYEIFQPRWPLRRLPGCANKFWTEDLLLISRSFLREFNISYIPGEYIIQVVQENANLTIYDI